MSTPRNNANQSLYLARILLHHWGAARAAQDVPATALNLAFLPGVRRHLVDAYGWFLLEITGNEMPEDGCPPACRADLPPLPAGKAESGELREFERLESDGWLAELLAEMPRGTAARRSRDNLASPAAQTPDLAQAEDWAQRLETTMDRMRDSLEEC